MLYCVIETAPLGAVVDTLRPNKSYVDVIYLKDGSILKGELQSYEIGKALTFKLESGSLMTIPYTEVKKVIQRVDAGEAVEKYKGEKIRPYLFKFCTKNFFNYLSCCIFTMKNTLLF